MKYLYGPVTSRRLGSSLGIDILGLKTCSFDCIYCQLGSTPGTTLRRREYVPVEPVLDEIKEYLTGTGPRPDYLTFSGSGEPTLHSRLGVLIRKIKRIADVKVAVLTNSSLLTRPKVRFRLLAADLVVPSLDAATQPVFERVNRPHRGLRIDSIVEGLVAFRNEFTGELRLEVLLIAGVNDTEAELEALRKAAGRIAPDAIDINTVARPPAQASAAAVSPERLTEIARSFGPAARAVAPTRKAHHAVPGQTADKVLALLRRRPCSFAEICSSLGIEAGEAAAALTALSRKGLIRKSQTPQAQFYHAR